MRDVARMDRDFSKIPKKHFELLSFDYKKDRIDRLKRAVLQNAAVLNKVVGEYQGLFECDKLPNGLVAMKP